MRLQLSSFSETSYFLWVVAYLVRQSDILLFCYSSIAPSWDTKCGLIEITILNIDYNKDKPND